MNQPSPQPPKKTIAERLVDVSIKALAGFGGCSSLFFLFNNELSKALIAVAIAAGLGLLSSFGDGLMKVLKDWANKRGEGLGKNLTDKADRALDRDRQEFEDKYYRHLIYHCRDYRTQGLKTKGPFTLDLEKVFVPLRVAPESASRISPAMIRRNSESFGLSIWGFLAATHDDREPVYPSMAILGAPGSGKTTLLEHLTLVYAQRKHKEQSEKAPTLIPIPIYLRDIWEEIATGSPNLASLIEQQEFIKKLAPPSHWFEDRLRCSDCLVLLDGLDEVADKTQRKCVSDWVSQQIQDYPEVRFILTSRPFGFNDKPVKGVDILEVQPFNLSQMQEFVQNWYLQREIMSRLGKDDPGVREVARSQADDLIDRISNNPSLAAMALNPLLLTMIATVHCYRGALPGRRVELYAEICDVLLGRRREAKGIVILSRLTAEQRKAVLQVLALELMKGNTREFTLEEGSSFIKDELLQVAGDRETPKVFLASIETESGLLVERENSIYEFAHKSFQEYLAAVQIKELNQEQILTKCMADAWWDETIRLYAAQGDATHLIQAVLEEANPNINALKLALDCKDEGLRVQPEVRKQLEDKLEAGLESTEPEIALLAAKVKLFRRLSDLLRIDENREISQRYISRAEYQLYTNDYATRIFEAGSRTRPVTGISGENALGFCGWLSFMARWNMGEDTENLFYYRLPTATEVRNYPAKEYPELECWNIEASLTSEKGIRVVKTSIPSLLDFDTVTVDAAGQEVRRKSCYRQFFTEDLGNRVALDMIAIFGGTFLMGSPKGEGHESEKPQHQVTVPSFFMGKTPVTQAQWRAIASRTDLKVDRDLNPDPARFKGDRRPIEQVSWYDAVEFCKRLSKLTGQEYRLPSEAEWEYACRAGTTTPFSFGETITGELANYNASKTYAKEPQGQYRGETTSVGSFAPNAFGLYDMHGNVGEWCADDWHGRYANAPTDGSAWTNNENDNGSQSNKESHDLALLRGGSWYSNPNFCRSAYHSISLYGRDYFNDNCGFRVGCDIGRTL